MLANMEKNILMFTFISNLSNTIVLVSGVVSMSKNSEKSLFPVYIVRTKGHDSHSEELNMLRIFIFSCRTV